MSKYEKGMDLLNKLHGGHTGEATINAFKDVCPKMAELTIESVFGDIMLREGLDLKTRELSIVSSLVTLGHSLPQVRAHVEAALNAGATKIEIIEILLQLGFYAGFPACINAMLAVKDLLS